MLHPTVDCGDSCNPDRPGVLIMRRYPRQPGRSRTLKQPRSTQAKTVRERYTARSTPISGSRSRRACPYAASTVSGAAPFRSTDHGISGRSSSQVTAPAVASSIAGQRSAGTLPRRIQLFTVCEVDPMAFARAVWLPMRSIALVSASIGRSYTRGELKVNTWCFAIYTRVVGCTHEHGQANCRPTW